MLRFVASSQQQCLLFKWPRRSTLHNKELNFLHESDGKSISIRCIQLNLLILESTMNLPLTRIHSPIIDSILSFTQFINAKSIIILSPDIHVSSFIFFCNLRRTRNAKFGNYLYFLVVTRHARIILANHCVVVIHLLNSKFKCELLQKWISFCRRRHWHIDMIPVIVVCKRTCGYVCTNSVHSFSDSELFYRYQRQWSWTHFLSPKPRYVSLWFWRQFRSFPIICEISIEFPYAKWIGRNRNLIWTVCVT